MLEPKSTLHSSSELRLHVMVLKTPNAANDSAAIAAVVSSGNPS
jgi:hypothetical protein